MRSDSVFRLVELWSPIHSIPSRGIPVFVKEEGDDQFYVQCVSNGGKISSFTHISKAELDNGRRLKHVGWKRWVGQVAVHGVFLNQDSYFVSDSETELRDLVSDYLSENVESISSNNPIAGLELSSFFSDGKFELDFARSAINVIGKDSPLLAKIWLQQARVSDSTRTTCIEELETVSDGGTSSHNVDTPSNDDPETQNRDAKVKGSNMVESAKHFLGYHNDLFSGSNRKKDNEEIEGLLSDWGVTSHDQRSLASGFAQTMSSLLNFDKEQTFKDRPAQIAILLALWDAIEAYPELARASFSGSKLNPERSKLELRMRLASRMFFYGRRVLFNYSNVSDAAANFERSIELFSIEKSDLNSLKDFQASKLLGMRGTTRLFLGRLKQPSLDRWLDAYADLMASYELGNTGKEALKSLRELALKILDLERSIEGFERFEKVAGLGRDEDHKFHSDTAIFHQYRATYFIENSQPELALEQCRKGLGSCAAAISLAPPPADEAFSRNTQAFFRQVSMQQAVEITEGKEIEELNKIIEDLRFSYEFKLGGAGLPLALLRRSFLFKKAGHDSQSLEDLTECMERLELIATEEQRDEISRNAQASIADIRIRQAAESDDFVTMISLSHELLKLRESSWFYLFTIATNLSKMLRARAILDESLRTKVRSLIAEFTKAFSRAQKVSGDEALSNSLALAASYAANSSRILDQEAISDKTVRLYELALTQGSGSNVEFASFAGNVSLQYAKQLASRGDDQLAAAHFRDAVERFKNATNRIEAKEVFDEEALKPVVVYSKLGEACLRLAKSGDRDLSLYREAKTYFEKARELGNNSPELTGLIGDVFYRLGFWGNDSDALQYALKMKEQASADGNKSRENSSVTARICEALYSHTRNAADIESAVGAVLDAIDIDADWPWPFFQLAEIISGSDVAFKVLSSIESSKFPPVIKYLSMNTSLVAAQSLRIEGIERILANSEFKQHVLGGRSKVFVLDDPHRLISSSIVLKPTRKADAEREIGLTKRLRLALTELGEQSRFDVPAPIGTVDISETKCIYAMQRELGVTLADEVLGSTKIGYPDDLRALRETVRFLAIFHRTLRGNDTATKSSNWLAKDISERLKKSSNGKKISSESFDLIAKQLPSDLPAVSKKDGHAENWIVGPYGKIVSIDLEATKSVPVLLDLAQLFEDFPAIPVSDDGWRIRMSLVSSYWEQLGLESHELEFQGDLYEVMAIERAVWGIGFCRGRSDFLESSTSRKAISARLLHFEKLIEFLANGGGSGKFSGVASECIDKLRE